jgi:predicted nucleotidyltransferase
VKGVKIQMDIPQKKLEAFCRHWQITELALFGSALCDNFRPDSDVDLLARFDPNAHHTLLDMFHMQEELRAIFGREVDLVSRRGIETSRNHLRRQSILASVEVVYGS